MNRRLLTIALVMVFVAAACGDDDAAPTTTLPEGAVIAEFRTPDGATFRTLLTGDAALQARTAFAAGERPGIPNGRILPGDGGINLGHEWHVVDVEFADITIEVCDGTVSYIDEIGYEAWAAGAAGQFCPWGAELVGLVDQP